MNCTASAPLAACGRSRHFRLILGLLLAAALVHPLVRCRADAPVVSQVVGVLEPVRDEFGRVLEGTPPQADVFGVPESPGMLVQVLNATDGIKHPPNEDGSPHASNAVLQTTRIGCGTFPVLNNLGKFSVALTPRPSGSRIFVRVFNGRTLAGSSFSGDSQLFYVPATSAETFDAVVPATDQPLDSGDDDGDGLSNSMEISLHSITTEADSDLDGMSDLEEFIAGTEALELDSQFLLTGLEIALNNGHPVLVWPSVAGRTYQVQDTGRGLGEGDIFSNVTSIDGTGDSIHLALPLGDLPTPRFYRVRVSLIPAT